MNSGRSFVVILGFVAALLIIGQLVLGQMILSGHVKMVKAHQHSGYTTVLVTLVYIGLSLRALTKKG